MLSDKELPNGPFALFDRLGRNDRTIMMLDMDEWYLLFQPLFENYLESIKSDQRKQSVSGVRPVSDSLFYWKKCSINMRIHLIRPEISVG